MIWNPFAKASKSGDLGSGDSSPDSYAQWSACLDELGQGNNDEACLARLNVGSLSWTGGVAPLFVERISNEVQRRLEQCSRRLQRDMQAVGQESLIVRGIVQARQQLDFVHRLCQLPALPEATRQQLAAEVDKFAQRAQSSLQESAKADRSGRLELLFRNNPLTRYIRTEQAVVQNDVAVGVSASGASGISGAKSPRRNILL